MADCTLLLASLSSLVGEIIYCCGCVVLLFNISFFAPSYLLSLIHERSIVVNFTEVSYKTAVRDLLFSRIILLIFMNDGEKISSTMF